MSVERRAYILRLLEERGRLRSSELARELGVTDESIRTDFVKLEAAGLLERCHGGAKYILPLFQDSAKDDARLAIQLADLLVENIPAYARVYLEDNLFSRAFVSRLGAKPCSLLLNSAKLLHDLSAPALTQEIHLAGGAFSAPEGAFLGQQAQEYAKNFAPEFAILSPDALEPLHASYENEKRLDWAALMNQLGAKLLFILPSSRLESSASHRLTLRASHALYTEDNYPDEFETWELHTVPFAPPVIYSYNENAY